MKRDKIACNCKKITYGMIEDAVNEGAASVEAVQEKLRYGTGCGKCREFIEFLIQDLFKDQNK